MSARKLGVQDAPAHPYIHRLPTMPVMRGQEERRRGATGVVSKALQVAPGRCYSQKPHHCLAVPEAALDEGEGEGSCNAEDILAEAGAGRKSSSSFTGILQAFPQNPLGTRFQGSPLNPGLTPEWTNRVTSSGSGERCLCEVCPCSLLIFQIPLHTSSYCQATGSDQSSRPLLAIATL